jgi:hypothetical protein
LKRGSGGRDKEIGTEVKRDQRDVTDEGDKEVKKREELLNIIRRRLKCLEEPG